MVPHHPGSFAFITRSIVATQTHTRRPPGTEHGLMRLWHGRVKDIDGLNGRMSFTEKSVETGRAAAAAFVRAWASCGRVCLNTTLISVEIPLEVQQTPPPVPASASMTVPPVGYITYQCLTNAHREAIKHKAGASGAFLLSGGPNASSLLIQSGESEPDRKNTGWNYC